jgi:acetyl-CoA synthetase
MLRTIWGDDERFKKQYFSEVRPGCTSPATARAATSRRLLLDHGPRRRRGERLRPPPGHRGDRERPGPHPVAEAAVVGRPDELKGQAVVCFVTLRPGHVPAETSAAAREHVAHEIGRFARPDAIRFADALPKTRSGKIMRRLLKEVASGVYRKVIPRPSRTSRCWPS